MGGGDLGDDIQRRGKRRNARTGVDSQKLAAQCTIRTVPTGGQWKGERERVLNALAGGGDWGNRAGGTGCGKMVGGALVWVERECNGKRIAQQRETGQGRVERARKCWKRDLQAVNEGNV